MKLYLNKEINKKEFERLASICVKENGIDPDKVSISVSFVSKTEIQKLTKENKILTDENNDLNEQVNEREKEIEAFVPESYYTVNLNIGGTTFESRRIENEYEAIQVEQKCRNAMSGRK